MSDPRQWPQHIQDLYGALANAGAWSDRMSVAFDGVKQDALAVKQFISATSIVSTHDAFLTITFEVPRDEWLSLLNAVKTPEEHSLPDQETTHALAMAIASNRIASPWRDGGVRLRAFGKWLAGL